MAKLWSIEKNGPAELRRWERVWETTGNVAAAWRCFRLARAWGLPVPLSVLAELDRVAAAIEAEVERVRAQEADATVRGKPAGLRRETMARVITRSGRGSGEPAAELIRWERDFAIAAAVGVLRHLEGVTEKEAVARVAGGTKDLAHTLSFENDRVALIAVETPCVTIDVVRWAVRRVRRLLPDSDGYA